MSRDELAVPAEDRGVPSELRSALFKSYAELLRRQRTASSALVRWSKTTNRSHEFVWFNAGDEEKMLRFGREIYVLPTTHLYSSVQKMHATVRLNPYEREVLYGYPYVIGRRNGKSVRAPLLTVPVAIEPKGPGFVVRPADDVIRFNSLSFRADEEAPIHEDAIGRILESTPAFPLQPAALKAFVEVLDRELPGLQCDAALDGRFGEPPAEPRQGENYITGRSGRLFIAPKTNYFLCSDLENMAETDEPDCGALGAT